MIKLNNQAGQDGYIFHFHLKFSNPLEVLRTHITNQPYQAYISSINISIVEFISTYNYLK